MNRALLVLGFALVPAAAHAGGYVTAGVGSAPDLGGELDTYLSGEGHPSARFGVGHGIGPLALELGVSGYGVHGTVPTGEAVDGDALSASLSATLRGSLIGPLAAFLRGGVQRTWIRTDAMDDLSGDGYVVGIGLDYGLALPIAGASVWIEVDREVLALEQGMGHYGGTADLVMAGVRVGL